MSLIDLPVDIHICICYFLDAFGILSLGQTCSILRSATHERTVWTTALQQACFQNHVLTSTFQPYNMSLEDIQHACTAPLRVLSKIGAGKVRDPDTESPPALPIQSHRLLLASDLNTDTNEEDHPTRRFRQFILTPGGRFLLAYSQDEIIVYDLNRSGLRPPYVAVQLPYPDEDFTFVSAPSQDGEEIRLALSRNIGTCMEVCIIRFIFNDGDATSTPSFKHQYHITQLLPNEHSETQPYTLTGDLFIFVYDESDNRNSVILVWNFLENTFVKWVIDYNVYKEIFLDKGLVILVAETSMQGFVIPPLKPRSDEGSISMRAPLFYHSLTSGEFPSNESPICIRLLDWYNTMSSLQLFSFLAIPYSYGQSPTAFSLTVQPRYPNQWCNDVPVLTVSHPSLGHMGQDSMDESVDIRDITRCPLRLCDGSYIESFISSSRCFVSSTPSKHSSDETMDVFDGVELSLLPSNPYTYFLGMRLSESFFAFDPFSGRLAYMSSAPDSEGCSEIAVLDYLKAPPNP